ncbi:hypothetical protein RG47T_0528 [Mucilaginibacter polytrichastri]|uniref:Uncharacterized protein n=1 Tax=Mucilaginibacter polytrichastri TaxID=1302689 RepID=A0A1Q5ZTI9_9SPHI|nr:hypothetical protein RG47T_0528 [Mucilaginibacter polytrichastri]
MVYKCMLYCKHYAPSNKNAGRKHSVALINKFSFLPSVLRPGYVVLFELNKY